MSSVSAGGLSAKILMRNYASQTSTFLMPAPATTEAVDLGCTCRLIGHQTGTDEKEPAGMLIEPNPNCPVHGTAIQPRSPE